LSCGFEKNGYIATCKEVAVDKNKSDITIVRVVEAFDCGAVVTPLQLKSQIEGSIVQAIGGAMFESIQFANGKILSPRFATYRAPRFTDRRRGRPRSQSS
jgi:isoquinoline 1-oxidoreductase